MTSSCGSLLALFCHEFSTFPWYDFTGGLPLGLLLSAFLGGRIVEDIRLGNLLLVIIDSLLSFMIFIYFFLYAGGAIWLGKRRQKRTTNSMKHE